MNGEQVVKQLTIAHSQAVEARGEAKEVPCIKIHTVYVYGHIGV